MINPGLLIYENVKQPSLTWLMKIHRGFILKATVKAFIVRNEPNLRVHVGHTTDSDLWSFKKTR